jgi:hypothetical protein
VIGSTDFNVEDDKTGAGWRVTRTTVLIVDGEGLGVECCEVIGTTAVEAGDEATTTTAVEFGDKTTGTTAVEGGGGAFGPGCIRVRVDEVRIGSGGVTVATRTVTIVEDETISMTEPGKLVGE